MAAILIGFEYFGDKKLPGILIDLYLAYKFLINNNNLKITIISDIKRDSNTKLVRSAILEKLVDSNILSFVKDSKELGIYKEFKSSGYYNNLDSFLSQIEHDKLFIYYTGHSKNGNIMLPNGSLYSLDTFRLQISKAQSVLCILDCCESTGLNLPFRLIDGVYRLENIKYSDNDSTPKYLTNFTKSKIVCISSSLSEQDSFVLKTGSIFTRYIFSLLQDMKNKSLSQLLDEINLLLYKFCKYSPLKLSEKYGSKQTVNVYSSHPHIKWVFGWLYGLSDLDIRIDKIYKCVEIIK